jgi:ribosomal protein L29
MPRYEYTVLIDAPVHSAFEYCRDPRKIYAGDPVMKIADASVTDEGVGTRAHLTSRVLLFVEDVTIDYVEVTPDQRIVFEAHPTMTPVGLGPKSGISIATHRWTWTFASEDGSTRLDLVVVEQNPPRWQRAMDRLSKTSFNRQVRDRLARIKATVEEEATAKR